MPSWLLPALSGACVMLVLMLVVGWGLWLAIVRMLAGWISKSL